MSNAADDSDIVDVPADDEDSPVALRGRRVRCAYKSPHPLLHWLANQWMRCVIVVYIYGGIEEKLSGSMKFFAMRPSLYASMVLFSEAMQAWNAGTTVSANVCPISTVFGLLGVLLALNFIIYAIDYYYLNIRNDHQPNFLDAWSRVLLIVLVFNHFADYSLASSVNWPAAVFRALFIARFGVCALALGPARVALNFWWARKSAAAVSDSSLASEGCWDTTEKPVKRSKSSKAANKSIDSTGMDDNARLLGKCTSDNADPASQKLSASDDLVVVTAPFYYVRIVGRHLLATTVCQSVLIFYMVATMNSTLILRFNPALYPALKVLFTVWGSLIIYVSWQLSQLCHRGVLASSDLRNDTAAVELILEARPPWRWHLSTLALVAAVLCAFAGNILVTGASSLAWREYNDPIATAYDMFCYILPVTIVILLTLFQLNASRFHPPKFIVESAH